uniref:Uncharacterized protein n=1 Tax=Wuchereria bancrofti TaxID=6293 RepID=A0A1I8EYK9_WUCBA
MLNDYVIYQMFWLVTLCLLQGTPLQCDISLLLEYLNYKDYEYYLGVAITHEPAVIKALQAQDIRCSFDNMHPVLIGLDLNVTIIVNFDSITNQLTIIVAESVRNQPTHFRYFYRDQVSRLVSGYTDIFLTTIDMGRGLLHFVHQNNNESSRTGHEVLQIKTIDSGIRITKIRSEEIHMKFSQLIMDPSGAYAFYAISGKNKQQSVYKMKVDYPNFTLDAQKTSQEKAKIFTVNQDDRIFPVDGNALLVWKFAGEKSRKLQKCMAVRRKLYRKFAKKKVISPNRLYFIRNK